MANFSFLNDKSEFSSFAKDCIGAEQNCKNSPNDCVKLVRSALEASIKWLFKIDKKFVKVSNDTDKLFALMTAPTFEKAVGKNLLGKLHDCRKMGNQALHKEKNFNSSEAERSLRNLFDFVQWIDKNYGKNFKSRSFNRNEIPSMVEDDSMIVKVLKTAGKVAAGAIGAIVLGKILDKK